MRVVVATLPGVLELNWQWLPAFLGMNTQLKNEIDRELRVQIVGRPMTEDTLDWVHDQVVALILRKFPGVQGLREFFDGLKNISIP